jgi:hypothetical protein
MRKLLTALAFLAALPMVAQHAAPAAYGAVSGTITCVDTNLPARLINVSLQPIADLLIGATSGAASSTAPKPDAKPVKGPMRTFSIHQSHLDGTFLIPHVVPGRYYVIAQKPGYLSPVSQYSREQIEHPTPELRKILEETVPNVTVSANQTSPIDIRLTRAASVSGTILWDDGTPAPDLSVSFARKDKDGNWVQTNVSGRVTSDDLGHFHVAGLPPGEYRLSTSLSTADVTTESIFGNSMGYAMNTKENIAIYFGDSFFKRDAKSLKIEDGEAVTADFSISVSKLHTLSGTLIEARTGHVINAGTISFSTPDTEDTKGEEIISAKVEENDPGFHVDFIPEGNYIVKVSDAREVTLEEVPLCDGCIGTRQFKETVLKKYGPYEAPYTIQNDAVGVTFPIPASPAPTPPTN